MVPRESGIGAPDLVTSGGPWRGSGVPIKDGEGAAALVVENGLRDQDCKRLARWSAPPPLGVVGEIIGLLKS